MQETGSLEQASNQPFPSGVFAITFGAAFLLALILAPLTRRLGEKWKVVAVPGGRRQHSQPVSRIGGVAVYLAFVIAVIVSQLFVVNPAAPGSNLPGSLTVYRFDPKEVIRLAGLLIGGTLIFLVGLYDDWRELSPVPQYIAQVIAAGIAVGFLIFIEYVNNPITGQQTQNFPYLITVTISLFWLGLMMNTVNWLDGLDGLSTGVVAIACVVLFANGVFRLDPPQHSVALLPLALLGATLGFLPFNFSPARVFLGSSGAFFLGYSLGVLSIIGGAKMASILLVMGLPLLDLAWQIFSRLSKGKNPVQGDRGHLHFRLHDQGFSQRQIVIGYYVFCAAFGGLALFISSRLYKLIALAVMGVICLAGFIWLTRQDRKAG
jgi:UDP-GlcNAc:undecaprenyl-phosphate GlcNAc-1-phosphate transferase